MSAAQWQQHHQRVPAAAADLMSAAGSFSPVVAVPLAHAVPATVVDSNDHKAGPEIVDAVALLILPNLGTSPVKGKTSACKSKKDNLPKKKQNKPRANGSGERLAVVILTIDSFWPRRNRRSEVAGAADARAATVFRRDGNER